MTSGVPRVRARVGPPSIAEPRLGHDPDGVAELGRRALTGIELDELMGEAVFVLASDLGVEYANLLELFPDGKAVFRAGVGWRAGLVGGATVELGPGTPAGQVVLDQAPVLIEDLRTEYLPGPRPMTFMYEGVAHADHSPRDPG